IGLDHLEYRIADAEFRDQLLPALEDLLFRQQRRVWVTSTCDPIDHLRELEDLHQNSNGSSITNGTSTIDFDRWNRLFQSFHKEVIGVSNQSMPGWLQRLESTFDRGKIAAGARKTIRDECAVSPQLQSVAERIVKRLPDRPGWSDRDLLNEIGYSA